MNHILVFGVKVKTTARPNCILEGGIIRPKLIRQVFFFGEFRTKLSGPHSAVDARRNVLAWGLPPAEPDNTASRFGLRHWRFSDRDTGVIDRSSSTIKEANHTRIVNFLARHGVTGAKQ